MRKCDVCGKIKLYMKYMEQIKKYVIVVQEIFLFVLNVEPYTSKMIMKMAILMEFAEENVPIKNRNIELIIR